MAQFDRTHLPEYEARETDGDGKTSRKTDAGNSQFARHTTIPTERAKPLPREDTSSGTRPIAANLSARVNRDSI